MPSLFPCGMIRPCGERELRRVFGEQAEALIVDAQREGRNTPEALQERADAAASHWEEIRDILLPVVADKTHILAALDAAGVPGLCNPQALGFDAEDILDAFTHARDLRSRYIFPALVFDLGADAMDARKAFGAAGDIK